MLVNEKENLGMIVIDKYDETYHEHLCDECGSGEVFQTIDDKELCEECIRKYYGDDWLT